MDDEVASLTRERDLYRQLLELGLQDDPETFLEKALSLFIDAAGARRGCLELCDPTDDAEKATFFIMRGMEKGPKLGAALAAAEEAWIAAGFPTEKSALSALAESAVAAAQAQ